MGRNAQIKMAGRVLAIASFHSETLFTSFARQTNEAENSAERETLQVFECVTLKKKKRGDRDVCCPVRVMATDRRELWLAARCLSPRASLVGSLDFCLSSVFCRALLYLSTFFRPRNERAPLRVYIPFAIAPNRAERGGIIDAERS